MPLEIFGTPASPQTKNMKKINEIIRGFANVSQGLPEVKTVDEINSVAAKLHQLKNQLSQALVKK